jgi:hypothetical protein
MNWLNCILYQPFWTTVSAIALIITLIYIKRYTEESTLIAKSSTKSLEFQKQQILLSQKPVISIVNYTPPPFTIEGTYVDQVRRGYHNKSEYDKKYIFIFRPIIKNFSYHHAKLRVIAKIKVNGNLLLLPPDHYYSGYKIWLLQAGGANTAGLMGNLNFPGMFKNNKIDWDNFDISTCKARFTIECWVANINRPEIDLYLDENKNPILQWYWEPLTPSWVPELSPNLGESECDE